LSNTIIGRRGQLGPATVGASDSASESGAIVGMNPQPPEEGPMRSTRLIPIAVLALALACSEDSPNLVENNSLQLAAGSPHFIGNATECTEVGLTLVCEFKEAGLSSGAVETIQVSVFASREDSCVNNGGNIPEDPKKTTTAATVTASGQFTAGKNGNVIGSLTVSLPPTSLTCPPGQTATLISSTFVPNATITDLTSGASISVGGF
jgi:hypothetical protein